MRIVNVTRPGPCSRRTSSSSTLKPRASSAVVTIPKSMGDVIGASQFAVNSSGVAVECGMAVSDTHARIADTSTFGDVSYGPRLA